MTRQLSYVLSNPQHSASSGLAHEFERGSEHRLILVLSEHAIADEFDATGSNYAGRIRCLCQTCLQWLRQISDVFLTSTSDTLGTVK
jgi:hypothetical protein